MREKIKTILKGILWTAFIGICLYATFIGGPRDRKKNEIPKPTTEVYIVPGEQLYHDGGCETVFQFLVESEIVTQKEAREMGRTPCSICEPDKIIEMEMEIYNELIQNQEDPPPQYPYY